MHVKKKRIDFFPYLLLIPSVILLLGITLYPLICSVYYSFTDYSFARPDTKFVGFENYIDILEEGKFISALGFTCFWTVCNLLVMVLLGFITALLLHQRFWGRGILKAVILIPWILPQVVTGSIFNLMLAQNIGIINRLLYLMGLIPADFSWFSSTKNAIIAVVMANSWRGFPFIALMVYSKMQSVPESYLEAAELDGANSIQKFCYIMFPYIKQVLLTCCFLVFLWTFNAYDIIKTMTNGGPLEGTVTLSFLLQKEAFSYMEIGRACAMAILIFIFLVGIFITAFFVRGLVRRVVNACKRKK